MSSLTFDPTYAPPSGRHRRPSVISRPGHAPRPVVAEVATVLAGLGFGACVALAVTAESWKQFSAPGGVAMFLGNLTGLAGTYLALVMVLLVSRIPVVERVLGQDKLLASHRRLAPWPISLIVAHAVLLTFAYAEAARTGVFGQIGAFIRSYPDMLTATIALAVMVAVAITSVYSIRRRLRRETWWAVHLFMYLALALAFAHEIALGPSFVGHPLTRFVWSVLWASSAGLVLVYRFGLPLYRTFRHRLEVVEIHSEGPDTVSVICRGRNLDRLAVAGGQFFEWRFLTKRMWWQAHPFTLSARPRPPFLRITVKGIGDYSSAVARLRPGTRVAIEGPYGAFTTHARRRVKVALIAGGIGVTAIRSLLEDLPRDCDPVVILRASSTEELALASEVSELVRHRKGRVHELVGPRSEFRVDRLAELVPDLANRDVYVSGPEGFVDRVVSTALRLGVPEDSLHYEVYSL
ncbi:MAG: ferric reductase-like transmembrane domain-containing protein [Acidimicrobiales bacterium]|jgi:predicted ferric reductase